MEIAFSGTMIETETVSLTVIGSLNATMEFTVLPSQTFQHDIEMYSSYPSVSEELGRTISFPLTILNESEGDGTFDL